PSPRSILSPFCCCKGEPCLPPGASYNSSIPRPPWSSAMKIPLKWLADYVPLELPVSELVHRLTMAGLEVGAFRSFGLPVPEGLRIKQEEPGPVWDRDKVLVARIARVEKHPNADRLKLPTVEYGEGRTLQMVTGAPNIAVGDSGQKVVV